MQDEGGDKVKDEIAKIMEDLLRDDFIGEMTIEDLRAVDPLLFSLLSRETQRKLLVRRLTLEVKKNDPSVDEKELAKEIDKVFTEIDNYVANIKNAENN